MEEKKIRKKSLAKIGSDKVAKRQTEKTAAKKSVEGNELFLGGGFGYLTLSEATKGTSFSVSYLTSVACQGKLKAFKVGDDWLTTKEWLAEFQKTIKEKIEREIVLSDDLADNFNSKFENRWVKLSPKKKRMKFNFKLPVKYFLAAVLLVAIIGSSAILAKSQPDRAYNFLIRAGKISDRRFIVANNFLTVTNLVYGFPLKAGISAQSRYFSFLNGFSGGVLYSLNNLNRSILKGGDYAVSEVRQVGLALAYVGRLAGHLKFSDEKITQSWHNFILSNNWSSEVAFGWEKVSKLSLGVSFSKGKVAGASASFNNDGVDIKNYKNSLAKVFSHWAVGQIDNIQKILEQVKNQLSSP
ncbi:hypothetical protein HZA71_00530 [Candidatus Falkowbacteria bacterium]|nr:hypothetical protein [Candidatus Falkowbacteria bacterium]